MQFSNQILISSYGLSADEEIILMTALKLLVHNGHEFKIIADNVSKAHLLILNVENDAGREMFNQSRDGQVKLLLTSTRRVGKNIISISLPAEVPVLVDILGTLLEKMQEQMELVRAKLPRVGGITKITNDLLTNTVFHLLFSAKENKDYVRIGTDGYPDIFVDGKNLSVITTASMDDINHIIKKPLVEHEIQKSNTSMADNIDGNISSLHNMLWMSAIACSNGQLLPGHNVDVPVRLKAWPNFTRNDFNPAYLKLAAVLAKAPVALSELEKLTQVPYSDIVNFYNAAYSVDLIEKNVSSTEVIKSERKISNERKGLFGKIADRLGFGHQKLNVASR